MNARTITTALAATVGAAGLLGLAAPGGIASAATPTAAPSVAAAKCDASPWAARIQGDPAGLKAGDRSGDYLFHDSHGMHLRVTQPSHNRTVYTGLVASSAAMRIDPVKLEKGDSLKLSANHKSFTFVFSNYGRIDGVNFHTDCASSITVSHLNRGSKTLPTDAVYLGATKAHPDRIPFTVHRTAPHPRADATPAQRGTA